MIEPISVAAAGKALVKATDTKTPNLVARLIGPTVDVYGQWWAEKAQKRWSNVETVSARAVPLLEHGLSTQGGIPPRIVARVFEEASWCDDLVMQQYFAGVLAGSRTPGGVEDRGIYWADQLARLGSVHIRVHHAIYQCIRVRSLAYEREHPGALARMGDLGESPFHENFGVFIPQDSFSALLGQGVDLDHALSHAVVVLKRESLIGDTWRVTAEASAHLTPWPGDPEIALAAGLATVPSHAGIELYLWAHGRPSSNLNELVRSDRLVELDEPEFKCLEGSRVGRLL